MKLPKNTDLSGSDCYQLQKPLFFWNFNIPWHSVSFKHIFSCTFLINTLLFTLMSMLTGVCGNASNTSFRRGIRLSFPSQWHSGEKRQLSLLWPFIIYCRQKLRCQSICHLKSKKITQFLELAHFGNNKQKIHQLHLDSCS